MSKNQKTINVNKTVTVASDVFMHVVEKMKDSDASFSEILNDLCRDGMEARKAQEPQAVGGSEDGSE